MGLNVSGDFAVIVRKLTVFLAVAFLFLVFSKEANASLVEIKSNGYVKINVLSAQDEIALGMPKAESISVRKVADETLSDIPVVKLASQDGKINLNVETDNGENTLDVTDYKGDVLEIEERPTVRKIALSIIEGKFLITQGEVSAKCEYPIEVNATDARMTIKAPTGSRVVAVFPLDAVESLVKIKLLSKLNESMILSENEKGDLFYSFNGAKTLSFFGIFDIDIPIKGSISAITGEILSIEGIDWSKLKNTFKIG